MREEVGAVLRHRRTTHVTLARKPAFENARWLSSNEREREKQNPCFGCRFHARARARASTLRGGVAKNESKARRGPRQGVRSVRRRAEMRRACQRECRSLRFVLETRISVVSSFRNLSDDNLGTDRSAFWKSRRETRARRVRALPIVPNVWTLVKDHSLKIRVGIFQLNSVVGRCEVRGALLR